MIELHYDDDHPREWYVRGHVSDEAAIDDVRAALEHERDEDDPPVPTLGAVRHTYARWGLGQNDFGEQVRRIFYVDVAKKRGAFPISVVYDLDHRAHEQRRVNEVNAAADALASWVQDRWPMAFDIKVGRWPILTPQASFHLPELVGWVNIRADKLDVASIDQRDREVFERLYAKRAP